MPALNTRHMLLERASADEANRTVKASLSSETPVGRDGAAEVLSHDAGAVDLSRAMDGLPLLFGHDRSDPIGIVEGVKLEGRRLVGLLRFGASARAAEVWADVEAGVLKYVSVSYRVDATQPAEGGYLVTKWTPFEASIVSVPADPTVGVGRSSSYLHEGNFAMPQTSTATTPNTQQRAEINAEIREMCSLHRMGESFAADIISRGLDAEAAGYAILKELHRRDQATGGHFNILEDRHHGAGATASRAGMVEALVARMGGVADHRQAEAYRYTSLVDLARECLERRGIRTTTMPPATLIERGLHGTSDFPELLQGAGNRVLREAYTASPSGIRGICRQSTVRDFRAKSLLILGDFPSLEKVNEHGTYHYGTIDEGKSSYALSTYGKIFGITRQALINDDLDAFGQMLTYIGRSAATFEADFLAGLLTSNPVMSDTKPLFHVDHGNLSTGGGSALSQTSLAEARRKMRLQRGLGGATILDVSPRFLVVPAALETTGNQLIASITPNTVATVNDFAGKLELVVDPRLDASSATAWYLAADAAAIDTIEYSYLESAGGPEVVTKEGFDIDGLQFKARLDFGAGIIDWRGLFKAAGV